ALKPQEPFGNPNREFPWGHTAGTHKCDNIYVKHFAHIPARIKVGFLDILRPQMNPATERGIYWTYPNDTVFGEILSLKDSEGKKWPFEIRTRQKRNNKWIPNVYRPVVDREEYDSYFFV